MMEDLMPPRGGDGGVADHGVATSMQVIVKAANQKYNDQTIQCQGSWTVKKLKAHLAKVYPCKPKENQQKIIFSGRLLQDHLVLKDVLRSFDPSCPTTVHLVCSPGAESQESSPAPEVPASSTASTTTTSPPSNAGLRRRATSPTSTVNSVGNQPAAASTSQVPSYVAQPLPNPQYPQNWNVETYNAWMRQYYSYAQQPQRSAGDGAAQDYQNMYYQYWQYYMYMHYAQHAHASGGVDILRNLSAAGAPTVDAAPAEDASAAPEAAGVPNNGEANAPAPAAAAAGPVGAAGGGGAMFEDEEEEGRNRDWLDWLYVGSRLGVLLSIIYFYSTVGRFMLVFGFCFLVYIVRNHLYANRNNNNRNQRNNDVPAANADAAAGGNAAEPAAGAAAAPVEAPDEPAPADGEDAAAPADASLEDDPDRSDEGQDRSDEGLDRSEEGDTESVGSDEPRVPRQDLGPTPWSIIVTIITSFFSSLVPQPPPAN